MHTHWKWSTSQDADCGCVAFERSAVSFLDHRPGISRKHFKDEWRRRKELLFWSYIPSDSSCLSITRSHTISSDHPASVCDLRIFAVMPVVVGWVVPNCALSTRPLRMSYLELRCDLRICFPKS
jgi:hypothetical protein